MKLKLCRSAIEALRCLGLPDARAWLFFGAVLPGARPGKPRTVKGCKICESRGTRRTPLSVTSSLPNAGCTDRRRLHTLSSYVASSRSTGWNSNCSLFPSHEGLECCRNHSGAVSFHAKSRQRLTSILSCRLSSRFYFWRSFSRAGQSLPKSRPGRWRALTNR
jgi:hypothetical protein